MANRVFTGMAEWRVADVMSKAGRLHDHAQVTRIAPLRQRTAQCFADAHTQRAAHTTDFQRVGQAGVNVIVAGNRMHLGFTTQAAEGA